MARDKEAGRQGSKRPLGGAAKTGTASSRRQPAVEAPGAAEAPAKRPKRSTAAASSAPQPQPQQDTRKRRIRLTGIEAPASSNNTKRKRGLATWPKDMGVPPPRSLRSAAAGVVSLCCELCYSYALIVLYVRLCHAYLCMILQVRKQLTRRLRWSTWRRRRRRRHRISAQRVWLRYA